MTPAAGTVDALDGLDAQHLIPLWSRMAELVTAEPASACRPHRWRYADARAALLSVGARISAEEAERRVLILENPGLAGSSQITTSLYGGLQLVLPGEVAPAHRHAQSALRFVLEGAGARTVIDGEPVELAPGDLVVTAAMAWHEHANDSEAPAIWLDALDIPVVRLFDASFSETSGVAARPVDRPPGYSEAAFGAGMRPAGDAPAPRTPLVRHPFARARAALAVLAAAGEPDPAHGVRLEYVNPLDGGPVLPAISAWLQWLPGRRATRPCRSTDATVLVCVEGSGRTRAGDADLAWEPGDVVVVPSWSWVVHEPTEDAVLFAYSDRAAQRRLGLWREERASR